MLELPVVLQTRRESADAVELHLQVPATLPCFAGHFPGHPMLPGVIQLGWAVDASRREFAINVPLARTVQLKFSHPIRPGARLCLRLERSGGRVQFRYASEAREYASGRLQFADAA